MDVTSSISSKLSSGRMPAKALASMVFPVPGGPHMAMLCPPEAAMINPLLAVSCPRMSFQSISRSVFCFLHQSQKAVYGAQNAVERKFSKENLVPSVEGYFFGGGQIAKRDRQIKRRSFLADVGRRERHNDFLVFAFGRIEARVFYSRTDAIFGFFNRFVW